VTDSVDHAPDRSGPHATFFDGSSSRRRLVDIAFSDRLRIADGDGPLASWDYADIRRADAPPGVLRLRCLSAPALARLEIVDAADIARCIELCPDLDAAEARRGTLRVVVLGLAASASMLGIVLFGLPLIADRITPLVPQEVDRRIGDAAERQVRTVFGDKTCNAREGAAALSALVGKVRGAADLAPGQDPIVVSSPIANAFALPGGKVVIVSGLIAKAENADEIAGVLGHEFGHLKHRDSMRNLVHAGGLSFLAGMMFGDVSGSGSLVFASRTLITASYSREVEQDADTFAIDTMHRLGRPPQALGNLLMRISKSQGGDDVSWLSSHPLTQDRLERMGSDDVASGGPPLLSSEQWAALKAICGPARKI